MGNCIFIDCCLKCKTNDLELYKLKGNFRAKVVDVYDGDTVTIVIFNKCGFEKHKLRMYGYDSPEMKPKPFVLSSPSFWFIKLNFCGLIFLNKFRTSSFQLSKFFFNALSEEPVL